MVIKVASSCSYFKVSKAFVTNTNYRQTVIEGYTNTNYTGSLSSSLNIGYILLLGCAAIGYYLMEHYQIRIN